MPRIRSEIIAEANRWFIELNEHPQDEATRRTFDVWLRHSPEHLHAFLQVSAHWEEYTPRPGAPVESIDELTVLAKSDRNVVNLPQQARVQVSAMSAPSARPRAARRTMALTACVVSIMVAALVWQQFFRNIHSTQVGEQYSLTLEDGSTVDLNSRTRIRVNYDARERHIELLEGQALFHVAKRPSQPFIVHSGNAEVRAIGTQFDVYRKPTGTVVTVVEGRVAVVPVHADRDDGAAPAIQSGVDATNSQAAGNVAARAPSLSATTGAVFLDAGQQLSLDADAQAMPPARLEKSDIEAVTAWTQRRLIFKGTPLSAVVSEFNRYSERSIVITDPRLASIPISGVFSSSDPTDLLRFLREVGSYDVRETRTAIEISQTPR